MDQKQINISLFLLVIFGAAIRLFGLGNAGLHVDEKYTVDLIQHSFWYVLQFALSQDCNPPIYYMSAWISTHALGITAFAERLPAALAGIALIPAAYLLGKEYRGELAGLLTAAMVTVLGSMWYYSRFGRAYSMICLFFTLALVVYLKIIKGDTDPKTFLAFGLLSSLCVWTHLFALVPLAFMGAYIVWESDIFDQTKWYLIGLAPTVLMAGTFWAIHSERESIMQGWYGNTVQQLLNYMPLEYFGYAWLLVFALILAAVWFNKDDIITVSMGWIWVLSFVAQLIISLITPVFVRYTLLLIPMLCAIAIDPVVKFIESHEDMPMQRNAMLAIFGGMFLAIQAYQQIGGFYLPTGEIHI